MYQIRYTSTETLLKETPAWRQMVRTFDFEDKPAGQAFFIASAIQDFAARPTMQWEWSMELQGLNGLARTTGVNERWLQNPLHPLWLEEEAELPGVLTPKMYCPICFDDVRVDQCCTLIECGHRFCNVCVDSWYGRQGKTTGFHCRREIWQDVDEGDSEMGDSLMDEDGEGNIESGGTVEGYSTDVAVGTDITSDEGLTGPCSVARLKYTNDFSYDDANEAYITLVKGINKHVAHGHFRIHYRVMDDFERSPGLSALLQNLYSMKPKHDVGQAIFLNAAIRKRFADPERTVGQIDEMNNMLGVRNINEPRVQDNVEEEVEEEDLAATVEDHQNQVPAANNHAVGPFALGPAYVVFASMLINAGQIRLDVGPDLHPELPQGLPHGLPYGLPHGLPQPATQVAAEVEEETDENHGHEDENESLDEDEGMEDSGEYIGNGLDRSLQSSLAA
ncbi:hypothetical protein EJ03DRAFT_337782 [Teratosphaeria nubilosa]|uniref:RING-type domain-containing protein n=1 Tax=Teratosphaeria nubilosa TaxID=161662 RepID=A0A6G1L374_9PEZI|nr:hypothetical protein EJ03DRAFT_337782 [Teratosphaeria nubilosa]